MTAGAYSIPEVQRLVATLVASKPGGRIAELGTSYGDGAKAILAALPPRTSFVTVELDPDRAAQARKALAGTEAEGDWREALADRGPFDLIFADGGTGYDRVIDLLSPGGILIKDDLTPGRLVESDATRKVLLLDERVEAVEIMGTPEMACIIAVRRA